MVMAMGFGVEVAIGPNIMAVEGMIKGKAADIVGKVGIVDMEVDRGIIIIEGEVVAIAAVEEVMEVDIATEAVDMAATEVADMATEAEVPVEATKKTRSTPTDAWTTAW